METIKYIVVRVGKNVKVLFEDEFIGNNEFRTQNEILEVLGLLCSKEDFDVELHSKIVNKGENE